MASVLSKCQRSAEGEPQRAHNEPEAFCRHLPCHFVFCHCFSRRLVLRPSGPGASWNRQDGPQWAVHSAFTAASLILIPYRLELEIQRELKLSRTGNFDGLGKGGEGLRSGSKPRIDLGDVGSIEQVESIDH